MHAYLTSQRNHLALTAHLRRDAPALEVNTTPPSTQYMLHTNPPLIPSANTNINQPPQYVQNPTAPDPPTTTPGPHPALDRLLGMTSEPSNQSRQSSSRPTPYTRPRTPPPSYRETMWVPHPVYPISQTTPSDSPESPTPFHPSSPLSYPCSPTTQPNSPQESILIPSDDEMNSLDGEPCHPPQEASAESTLVGYP